MGTMQATKAIKCGGCKGYHPTLAEVKACCLSGQPTFDNFQQAADFEAQRAAIISTGNAASERQMAFIETLLEERDHDLKGAVDILKAEAAKNKKVASALIKQLLSYDKASSAKTYGGPATGKLNFPDVPEGHYAVASETGNNDLDFFRVDRPTEGKWAGRTFVKRVVGGKPDFGVRGEAAVKVCERIVAAGVREAALLYGQEIGRCCRCNRHLTDEDSRAFGMGPDCRQMAGW